MNLHAIAMKHISRVHPGTNVIAIRCLGQGSDNGRIRYHYGKCEKATAQKQYIGGDDSAVHDAHIQIDMQRKFYLALKGPALDSGNREHGTGGAYLYEPDTGDLWKVFSVAEDFKSVGWALYFGALQVPGTALPEVIEALNLSGLLTPKQIEIFRGRHGKNV